VSGSSIVGVGKGDNEREVFSNRLNDRDGTFTDNRGADNFTDSEGNENIFYSKIDVLDKLLDLYDELKI
jgi:hypothetical protein